MTPCRICGTATARVVDLASAPVAVCSDPCTVALVHELWILAAVGELLALHGDEELLAQFRRGDWRPSPKDEPTGGDDAGDPQSPGDGTARELPGASSCAVQGGATTEAEKVAVETDMRVVLLSDGALMVFRADTRYRVLRRIGNGAIPDSFRAHELADEYEDRATMLREAIQELT